MIIPAPSTPASEPPIISSAFWPEIDPVKIREAQRLDNTVTPERLRHALIEAIATTNESLAAYRQTKAQLGVASLDAIESEEIDGTSILVLRYERAVGSLAKALLLERLRDFDTTGKGERKAEQAPDTIDDCRRDHLHAVADIAGRPRSTIELI